MNLLDRLEYVMAEKGWSADEWSLRAGLSRSHLNTTLRRLRKKPNATVRVPTLEKLAKAADRPVEWFTGSKVSASDFVRVEEDKRYPSRGQAVTAARFLGWSPEAIGRVLAVDTFDADPGQKYWMALLDAENNAEALRPVSPIRAVKKRRRASKSR